LHDLPWGTFDVVTCWDVLEHTPDPAPFAARLVELVRPGGWLFLTTLNWNSLVRRAFGMKWFLVADDHFTYWTETALQRVLESLERVSITSFGVGRDFIKPFEALARRRLSPSAATKAAESGRSWDAARGVVATEDAVNAMLGRGRLGVDLYGTFRRSRSPAQSNHVIKLA
jgi:SAM-dependent methyltransferase